MFTPNQYAKGIKLDFNEQFDNDCESSSHDDSYIF